MLEQFVNHNNDDLRTLFRGDQYPLTERLAKFYGAQWPGGTGFQTITLDSGKRSGILTHPYLLAANAYYSESSPIHRGVFLAKGVLGTGLKPPADAFSPLAPDLHPTLTTRERVLLQTKSANCQTCHTVINNLGFTLENFDAAGRFRDKDRNKPVDPAGEYLNRDGKLVRFTGPAELTKFLAESPDVHAAFAEQLFHHLVQQPVRAYGPNAAAELRQAFATAGYSLRSLSAEIAVRTALKPEPNAVSNRPTNTATEVRR
jgi:hypothetical protein